MFELNHGIYIVSKYINYVLLFIRGFFLAKILGPTDFGFLGYLILIQFYLIYSNSGIPYGLNNEISTNSDKDYKKLIVNSSFILTILISFILIVVLSIISFSNFSFFNQPNDLLYLWIIILLTICVHFQQLFITIRRFENKFSRILTSEIFVTLVTIIPLFLYNGKSLILNYFIFWSIGLFISILILWKPIHLNFKIRKQDLINFLKICIPLLLLTLFSSVGENLSRIFISLFYSTKFFGYFAFALNLSTAVMLVVKTFTWMFFPTVLKSLSTKKNEELLNYIVGFSKNILTINVLSVFLAIIFNSLIFYFIPEYINSKDSFILLLFTGIMFNSSFMLMSLIIAKSKIKDAIKITLLKIFIISLISLLGYHLNFNYNFHIFAQLLGFMFLFNFLCFYCSKQFGLDKFKLLNIFNIFYQFLFIFSNVIILIFPEFIDLVAIIFIIILLIHLKKNIIYMYSRILKLIKYSW